MSTYTEKIENHDVHLSISNVQNEINLIVDIEDKAPYAVETLARIAFIIENFSKSLECSNKDLIAITWLDEATRALNNIKSYLSNFKNNKDANSLANNSNSQLDIILQSSAKINCVRSAQSLRGITAAENEYKEIMDANNAQLYSKVKTIGEELDTLKLKISENENTSNQNIAELRHVIDAEKQRLDSLGISYQNQMSDDRKSFDMMISQLKESFISTQDERKQTFDKEMKTFIEERKTQGEASVKQSGIFEENANQLIDNYKQKFSNYEEQVKDIVGIVNANMFSHKYKEVADNAHGRAKFWHGVAIALMVIVSCFAAYAFVITMNDDTSWTKLIAKIFATTTLVTGAAYAARQASKQEKVERYARKIEMELVAIDPFISTLGEEKQAQIKEEIARKIFGNADAMEITNKDEAYTAMDKLTSIENILLSIIKNNPK